MAMSTQDKDFLRLVSRSPDCGAGWRHVSHTCWALVEQFHEPQLIEVDKANMRVRLTEAGNVVVKFAL